MESHIGESQLSKKKKKGQVNHCYQAAFHLLWLLERGLQPILDQALRPNLPLRLLYGSKLKWLCEALEQITSGIYGYSQLPSHRWDRRSLHCVDSQCSSWSKSSNWTDVHLFAFGIKPLTPFTYKSFKKCLHKVCVCLISRKLGIHFHKYLWCIKM